MSINGTSDLYSFPGFKSDREDTGSSPVIVGGTIEDGGAVFDFTLLQFYPEFPFVVANVLETVSDKLWKFKDLGFDGVSLLAKAGEVTVIALCRRGKTGAVERVIPLRSLFDSTPIDLETSIDLKRAAAAFLERKHIIFSENEKVVIAEAEAEARAAEEAARDRAEEERAKARAERIKAIRSRAKITVYTLDGKKLFGTPVTKNEWKSLNPGAYAVLVDSIGEDGKPQGVQSWFHVVKAEKRGSEAKQEGLTPVLLESPKATKVAVIVEPVRKSLVKMKPKGEEKEKFFEILLFASMDLIHAARKAGLNSGTLVAVNGEKDATVDVHSVHVDKGLVTVGSYSLLR